MFILEKNFFIIKLTGITLENHLAMRTQFYSIC